MTSRPALQRVREELQELRCRVLERIPIQDLPSRLLEVDTLAAGDKARPIVVYCAKGGRAGKAKQQLEAAGYTRVVNGGGFDDLR